MHYNSMCIAVMSLSSLKINKMNNRFNINAIHVQITKTAKK